jgi:LacI family transcriptional regulator
MARPEARKVTSHDVAQIAGVSPATVSRVLRGAFSGPDAVKEKVLKATAELGYQPNAGARQLRTGKTARLGILVPSFSEPGIDEILEAFAARAKQHGYGLLVWSGQPFAHLHLTEIAIILSQTDGLVWVQPGPTDLALAELLGEIRPVVMVNPAAPVVSAASDGAFAFADSVRANEFDGAYSVARYFADNGRLTVAAVGPLGTFAERLAGFRRGARTFDLAMSKREGIDCLNTEKAGFDAAVTLTAKSLPSAIFALSAPIARGMIDGFRSVGITAPAHTWVCAYGPDRISAMPPYQLTTVASATSELVSESFGAIIAKINDRTLPALDKIVATQVQVRGSTGHVAVVGGMAAVANTATSGGKEWTP